MEREKAEKIFGKLNELMSALSELNRDMGRKSDKCESADKHECTHDDECGACASRHDCDEIPDGVLRVRRGKAAIEALAVINGERQDAYGSPEDSFANIAELWASYAATDISPLDVAIMMALLKIGRLQNGDAVCHRDTFVDAIGYLALAADMAQEACDGASDDVAVDD